MNSMTWSVHFAQLMFAGSMTCTDCGLVNGAE
jgi:hypothetical protein